MPTVSPQAREKLADAQVQKDLTPAAGKPRGNTHLTVKGKDRARIPDEFDVILNDVIVGRAATQKERDEILAAAVDESRNQ